MMCYVCVSNCHSISSCFFLQLQKVRVRVRVREVNAQFKSCIFVVVRSIFHCVTTRFFLAFKINDISYDCP